MPVDNVIITCNAFIRVAAGERYGTLTAHGVPCNDAYFQTSRSSMNKNQAAGRFGPLMPSIGFYLLLFSYPVLSLLWRRAYPAFSTEVFLLFLVIFGISLVLGLITMRLRAAVKSLLMGIAILLTAMVQFNLFIEGLAITIAGIALVMVLLRERFQSFGILVLAALIAGAYLDSGREHLGAHRDDALRPAAKEGGPVIHILLDAFIGIAGLPDYPASELIREEILSFFKRNKFQLFSHAYSRYALTGDSLYSVMNFRHDGDSIFTLEQAGHQRHVMKTNAVFTRMEALGYRLNVYQTGHLDLCRSNPDHLDRCWQYDHPNINSVVSSNDTGFKFRALYTVLLSQSRLLEPLLAIGNQHLSALAIATYDPKLFEVLEQDILEKRAGNYYFAHALIPHGPYAYQPDCSVNYGLPPVYRWGHVKDEPELAPVVWEMRAGLYFGQMDCALQTLQQLFDALQRAGLYENATIILHGDHGSHITKQASLVKNLDAFTLPDYRANFSTLFAVKYPGSEFSIDDRVLPVSYLLEEFMAALPSYVGGTGRQAAFSPSGEADPAKTDSYVYFQGSYPLHRVDVNIFSDLAGGVAYNRDSVNDTSRK